MSNTVVLAEVRDKKAIDLQQEIQEVFNLQRANRWRIANTTAEERIAKLVRLRDTILRRKDELMQAMWQDFHKPAVEVEVTELQVVLADLSHFIHQLKSWMKPQKAKTPLYLFGTKGYVKHEPKGVVLILAPWNYPFNLFISPLVAAVAAGNCVMMRPSDKVQKTSAFMKSLVEEVFPKEEVAVFTGPSSVANLLLELPFDHIFFTGSTNVGKMVAEKAAKNLATITLELGGQSPTIVDETADIAASAERITWGKYINGGQTCVAPNHVFVHESVHDRFVAEVQKRIAHQYGKSEAERHQSDDYCRIVDVRSLQRIAALVDKSVEQGATLVEGGTRNEQERYLSPTVLTNVKPTHAIMSEEIFGPVMPIIRYRDVDEVIEHIRNHGKPLAMYIFSTSKKNIDYLLYNSTAGGTTVNNVLLHVGDGELPFGGVGESGQGNYHGFYGFRCFSHERAVLYQGKPASASMFYAPYTEKVQRMVGLLTKFLAR